MVFDHSGDIRAVSVRAAVARRTQSGRALGAQEVIVALFAAVGSVCHVDNSTNILEKHNKNKKLANMLDIPSRPKLWPEIAGP